MGQTVDQFFLGSNHHTVEIVMEVFLDIALTILGALNERYETGKTLSRLHTSQEETVVTIDCYLAHLQFTDVVAEGKFTIIQIAE